MVPTNFYTGYANLFTFLIISIANTKKKNSFSTYLVNNIHLFWWVLTKEYWLHNGASSQEVIPVTITSCTEGQVEAQLSYVVWMLTVKDKYVQGACERILTSDEMCHVLFYASLIIDHCSFHCCLSLPTLWCKFSYNGHYIF